jgi:hypothetical protein
LQSSGRISGLSIGVQLVAPLKCREESEMSSIERRKLQPLASIYCKHYRTRANFFIAVVGGGDDRNLVVKYEKHGGFSTRIPEDWSEEKIMLLIRTPWDGEYPIWEMSSRLFGSPMLVGDPSFVEGRPSWHFPQSSERCCSCAARGGALFSDRTPS